MLQGLHALLDALIRATATLSVSKSGCRYGYDHQLKSRSGKSLGAMSVHVKSRIVSHCAAILTHIETPFDELQARRLAPASAADNNSKVYQDAHPNSATYPSAESQSVSTMAI